MAERRGGRVRLFVYGTLRSGASAHRRLRGARRVGAGVVRGTLYDVDGHFPALVREGETAIPGEVWCCPDAMLPALDRYEGVEEGLFRRESVRVGGRECQVYVAGPGLRGWIRPERVVPGGRWAPPVG